ncbi:hypothetical protein IV38_GL001521 [Lactobacillus selangorensis]|uniref:Cyclophilin-like domain-containing protein n=1 Tax=Lactobacillus selangorensis TaxID=81857 RepID=A0A0R2FTT1_9LACO|nr:cyclophilin-like fold protein [Lactobacillus selangorensis]KRN28071.1 hypothetical protein IV38_GL001521 [Lactobacillus selangorensis]KRN31051.1 hypothetical protein IV40_GL001694 [Lactobacillus selangorensis]
MSNTNIKITVNNQTLSGQFFDNKTAQALLAQFPETLPMLNLYGREMTYRFKKALPTDQLSTSGYQVGDIAYWAPRHSFVIFYKQTGEVISDLQKIGHIDSDLAFLNHAGDLQFQFKQA